MKLLHIDSSILGEHSVSKKLTADIVSKLSSLHNNLEVTYRDVAAQPLPHLSGSVLAAASGAISEPDEQLLAAVNQGNEIMNEFLAADIVVVGVALYNFGISSQLKAWVDRIAVAGKTFRYTEAGPEGLAGNKKVILAVARGGLYGPDSPAAAFEHAERYMETVFGFVGITDIQKVIAEGVNMGAFRDQALLKASQQISALTV
ncbi:FMN-dependent NADH-azoreductase [Enterobacter cloacae subsp. cloacae]|uniref:FMN-dependent NADH-azoreductase n=1 Tax=Enterobacterales TaxID=91347 RepID=UPI0009A4C7BE|nr:MULTISPECIES: NAD(P)H-dependent oxidoreductase [Enterobacterales]OPJ93750.1 FMN-dependent NADH-azoreductase [Serratia marcescens]ORC18539.1 FMN-dependent NADH-azoreductase [Enterobacter cloacae subsp. cloacae]ORC28740.1 FMN-dependent NADH-azoreductase [Enterobacter cloacae subsp. cloacae]